MNDMNDVLDTTSQVLWRCFLIGLIFLFVWFGAFYFGRAMIERQGQWFGLTPHECALVAYGGMGFVKILIYLFFLFPYIAIRLVVRKRRR